MRISTNLAGRVRNTSLPKTHGLLPVFEAVSNAIHAIEDGGTSMEDGRVTIEILRSTQGTLPTEQERSQNSPIVAFKVTDNGQGFTDTNLESFLTLDSQHKADRGGRGVGRLLWLKAFARARVSSTYRGEDGSLHRRDFVFRTLDGVTEQPSSASIDEQTGTCVHLEDFRQSYGAAAPTTPSTIANRLLAHCLWYFVRPGSAPRIVVRDEHEEVDLDAVYDSLMLSAATAESIAIKDHTFDLIHVRLRRIPTLNHSLAFCAANRLVKEEPLTGKIPGLFARVRDDEGEFLYQCYVASPFLDERVRPERTDFDIGEEPLAVLGKGDVGLNEIRAAVAQRATSFLANYLQQSRRRAQERVESFVATSVPRYRPLLARIPSEELLVDPDISDKELELQLHRSYADLERDMVQEGQEVMAPREHEDYASYRGRLEKYLAKVEDLKKSDLANYVAHRRTIIDLLAMAIRRNSEGSYATEDLIHSLIMPLKKDTGEVALDRCNFWLIDERLAFHAYLASDKELTSMPLVDSPSRERPDLAALNVTDNPIFASETNSAPFSSIVGLFRVSCGM
ncbi:MAG: ATP-binding protein [Acidobacteriota bacterium]|nr:ATP-binding protein [Acidobacteriota bacterium]